MSAAWWSTSDTLVLSSTPASRAERESVHQGLVRRCVVLEAWSTCLRELTEVHRHIQEEFGFGSEAGWGSRAGSSQESSSSQHVPEAGERGEVADAWQRLGRALEAAGDVGGHVLHAWAVRASGLGWLPSRIAGTSYRLEDPGVATSPWVGEIMGFLSAFVTTVSGADGSRTERGRARGGGGGGDNSQVSPRPVPASWRCMFEECTLGLVWEAVLAGLSRVPSCTLAGRSRMMIDVQSLVGHIRSLALGIYGRDRMRRQGGGERQRGDEREGGVEVGRVDASRIEQYVQGYFLEPSEVAMWLQTKRHLYSPQQVVALVVLMADQRRMKHRAVRDLIAQVDARAVVHLP